MANARFIEVGPHLFHDREWDWPLERARRMDHLDSGRKDGFDEVIFDDSGDRAPVAAILL